jgi:nucleoside-diphosphate-sugar epimerase
MTAPETALVGYSGFVGGNLARAYRFDALYNSANIESIRGGVFRLLVCAGAPSLKWFANANPEADRASIARLTESLAEVRADAFVLISTIGVYPDAAGVDEDSVIDADRLPPYGRHRLALEEFVRSRFRNTLVVRLPGVFGPGLRKNIIYDFLRRDFTHASAAASQLQFYDVRRLWADIGRARSAGLGLLNVATEPVSLAEIGRVCTGGDVSGLCTGPFVADDMHSRHAALWSGPGPYLYSRQRVLDDLADFVADEAPRAVAPVPFER